MSAADPEQMQALRDEEREARAYAEDIGAEYCPKCRVVFHPQPDLLDDGHVCPARDGADGS